MMIEQKVIEYLNSSLGGVPAYMGETPAKHPTEYVRIKNIDGGRIDLIDAVTLNIECFSDSLVHAAELNKVVKNAMYDIVALDNISSSECTGGGQNINSSKKEYCYEAVFNLFYMEE